MRVTLKNRQRSHRRAGFTLVELLMVVLIVGILAGLLIPAVNTALKSVRQRAIAMECQTLANAIEQYRQKYGDYPPDGSDEAVLRRHLQKAFPNIDPSEITLLKAASNSESGGVMDHSEALVFFLGGFSADPVHPFTGKGGPFTPTPASSTAPYQYNVDRENAFFEFKSDQLTLDVRKDPGSDAPITISIDEREYSFATPPGFDGDLLPVYRPAGKKSPYVYFDSRTYFTPAGIKTYKSPSGFVGPYLSSTVNTKAYPSSTPTPTPITYAARLSYFRFVNPKSFQLQSAGIDDLFGTNVSGSKVFLYRAIEDSPAVGEPKSGMVIDVLAPNPSTSGGWISGDKFPTPLPQFSGFRNDSGSYELADNCTNFSNGALVDSVD